MKTKVCSPKSFCEFSVFHRFNFTRFCLKWIEKCILTCIKTFQLRRRHSRLITCERLHWFRTLIASLKARDRGRERDRTNEIKFRVTRKLLLRMVWRAMNIRFRGIAEKFDKSRVIRCVQQHAADNKSSTFHRITAPKGNASVKNVNVKLSSTYHPHLPFAYFSSHFGELNHLFDSQISFRI